MSDLTLYAQSLPLFETEEHLPEAAEGEEAPAAGLRVTGYNGTETEITVPQSIDGLTVYAVSAEAFPEGSEVTLPAALLEIDAGAFARRNITLYAQVGSVTEQLLLDAGCTLNAARHTLRFESSGGTLVDAISARTGDVVLLPAAVRDGGTLLGWYSDEALTVSAGAAGDGFTMPDADVTLYAAWDGNAPDYPFVWEQRSGSIAVVGSRNVQHVEIPAAVNGLPVSVIDEYAFSGDTALQSLSLPEGLEEIGGFVFFGSGLKTAELPGTLMAVGRYAFAGCRNLESFVWTASAPELSAGVLCGDSALADLTLPEGIVSIGDYALEGCSGLSTLRIPDSATALGAGALKNMAGLESLTLGGSTMELARACWTAAAR